MIFITNEVGGQFADDNFKYDKEGNLLDLKSDLHTWADKNNMMWERDTHTTWKLTRVVKGNWELVEFPTILELLQKEGA